MEEELRHDRTNTRREGLDEGYQGSGDVQEHFTRMREQIQAQRARQDTLAREDEETVYDQMETRLKEVRGGGPGSRKRPRQTIEADEARDARGDQCYMAEADKRGQRGAKLAERPKDAQGNLLNRLGTDGKPLHELL